jgi:hypothetical protein
MQSLLSDAPIEYHSSFDDEKGLILAAVLQSHHADHQQSLDLDSFESMVAIKNSSRVVTFENAAFRRYMMYNNSAIGTTMDSHFLPHLAKTSNDTDRLILDGVINLEIEHLCRWENGRTVTMRTFKRRLDELKSPNYAIIVISRAKDYVGSTEAEKRKSLNEVLSVLLSLDETDRTICRGYAMGDSTKEIASRVGLTSKAIENRRHKIMNLMGIQKPIEIVKLLVRLEENGLIDDQF